MSGGAKAGIGGIGGIILIALFTFLQGGNVGDVVECRSAVATDAGAYRNRW